MALFFDKDRLYLTLNHRGSLPGYHLSLIYAKKDEPGVPTSEVERDLRWHAINTDKKTGRPTPWRVEHDTVNQYNSTSLIARVLLLKVNSWQRRDVVARINQALCDVRLPDERSSRAQRDFTCAVWALDALARLQSMRVVFLNAGLGNLSEDRYRQGFYRMLQTFGHETMVAISAGRVDIATYGPSVIPVKDVRG